MAPPEEQTPAFAKRSCTFRAAARSQEVAQGRGPHDRRRGRTRHAATRCSHVDLVLCNRVYAALNIDAPAELKPRRRCCGRVAHLPELGDINLVISGRGRVGRESVGATRGCREYSGCRRYGVCIPESPPPTRLPHWRLQEPTPTPALKRR